jgi:hypothetical protein
MDNEYRDAVGAWALACLRGTGREKARALVDKRAAKQPIGALVGCFGLDALERAVVELAWAVERSFAVAKQAREAGGLTVEVVREALADAAVDAALAPGRRLVTHALCTVGEGGAAAGVRLAPGLAARLDGASALEALAPGIRLVEPAMGDRFPPSARAVEIVKDEVVGPESRLITIEGCGRRDALGLAVALARRGGRTVLVIDGAALAALPETWAQLAAARREADLEGWALLVSDAAELRGAWRAAAAHPPASASRPTLVVFADEGKPRETAGVDGYRELALVLHAPTVPSAPPAAAATAPAPAPEAAKPKEEDAYDHIRAMATRDAERAMGIFRPAPAPPRPVTTVPPAPPPPSVLTTAPPMEAPTPPPAPAPAPAAAPASTAPAPAAAAPVEAAPPAKRKRSKKALEHFGPDPSDEPAAPVPAATPAPAPAAAPAAAPTATAEEIAAAERAPYLPVSEKAGPEELARICRASPNPKQVIELMEKLAGLRSPAVIATLRQNAKSGHPGVRAAAERAMETLFGPNWNRPPPAAKPIVQPPRSDDDDRGPPGGF